MRHNVITTYGFTALEREIIGPAGTLYLLPLSTHARHFVLTVEHALALVYIDNQTQNKNGQTKHEETTKQSNIIHEQNTLKRNLD